VTTHSAQPIEGAGILREDALSQFLRHLGEGVRRGIETLLLSKNVNRKIVSEMLGHATISQTMDTYSHVMPGMGDIAAEALERALS
jgi:integrase